MSSTVASTICILIAFLFVNISMHRTMAPIGYLHPEAERMLVNYTDQRSLAQKVFDIDGTDWGNYSSRELSYMVDYLDYNFVSASISAGYMHFFSLSNYLGILVISIALVNLCRKHLGLDTLVTACLLSLFASSSCMILSGPILRSAKIGVGTSLAVLFCILYRNIAGKAGNRSLEYATIFAASLATVLFDMQGTYFIAVLIVILTFVPSHESFRRWPVIGILSLSIVAKLAYNYQIGPWLIHRINGYYPSFEYQRMDVREVVTGFPLLFRNGAELFYNYVSFATGNNSIILALILIFYFVVHPIRLIKTGGVTDRTRFVGALYPHLVAVVSAIMFIGMCTLMLYMHNSLLEDDIKRAYYPIPFTVAIIFGLAIAVKYLTACYGKTVIACGLIVLVIGNLASVPSHFKAVRNGHMSQTISDYRAMASFLPEDSSIYHPILTHIRHRALLIFMEREVRKNPNYQNWPPLYIKKQ